MVLAHPLGFFVFIAAVVFIAIVAMWNFIPSWRAKMKGYSTIAEGVIALAMGVFDKVSGGIQDAQAAGYIPPQLLSYVPIVLLVWFIAKRLVTTTAPGQKA